MSNKQLGEVIAVLAAKAGTANSTPLVTSYVSAALADTVALVAVLGDMAAETIDVALYQATDSGGTGAKALKAAAQLAAHASNNDNKVVVVSVRKEELDIANGFVFVAGRCVTGGATGGAVGLSVLGGDLRFGPASAVDSAAVVEVKI